MATKSAHREQVAGNVRAEMARARISQERLATALGISQAALSKRLTCAQPFTVDELLKIAEYLELEPAALFAATSKNRGSSCNPVNDPGPLDGLPHLPAVGTGNIRIRRSVVPAGNGRSTRVEWRRESGVAA